jgi:glycosyltransferase domain-containing protein
MEYDMSVSIIIPTYNRPDLLKVALNSCRQQTILPQEIIIGDDSPDDKTSIMLSTEYRNMPFELMYYHNNPPLKQAGNVDFLIKQVRTKYVMILHDDDWLLPCALGLLLNAFTENPQIIAAFGKQYVVENKGNYNLHRSEKFNEYCNRTEEYSGLIKTARHASLRRQFPSNGFLVKSDIAKNIGYIDPEAGNAVDFSFSFRMGELNQTVFFVNQYVSFYRETDVSITKSKINDSGYTSYRKVWNYKPDDHELFALRERFLKQMCPIGIASGAKNGHFSDALTWYISCFHRNKIFTLGGIRRLIWIIKALLICRPRNND